MAATLPFCVQTPDENLLDAPDVPDDIKTVCDPWNRNDGIADELTGSVVCDVPTTIDVDELRSDIGKEIPADGQVRAVAVPSNRVGVGVLEQQEIVIVRSTSRTTFPDRTLKIPRFVVVDAPEPPGTKDTFERHLSSCSQSQVSRFSLIRFKNRAAVDPSNTL